MTAIASTVPLPHKPRPIVLIGAGGIVRDAHLPAYRLAGFSVAGLFDPNQEKAEKLAADFSLSGVAPSLGDVVDRAPGDAIFDVAVPASELSSVLTRLPNQACVLIQKPFGENLDQARQLLGICRARAFRAAVNFQLRTAPCVVAARALIASGAIGELHDVEVRVTVHTPWHLWSFLSQAPRIEILYHSIHYVDLIRSFLGDPTGVHAKTARHPNTPKLAATRTSMLLDYGDQKRATITANHGHDFGGRHQESYVKWEGTEGAIVARLGVLLDYPRGEPDHLEWCKRPATGAAPAWEQVPLSGNWFPHAFIGPMAALMRYAGHETDQLPTRVEDSFKTMAVVEAAYESSARGATPIPLP